MVMEIAMKNKYAIVVLSCDKYSSLWKPFFSQFRKYWPQCPFNLYLGSNTKKYNDSFVPTILSGKGVDWSSDLLSILNKIREKYIFLWLDDFFPIENVDTKLFLQSFRFMKITSANHIHMDPSVHADGPTKNKLFSYYEKGAPYRVNVAGFWDKKYLETLLLPGENPWKFEIMGSYRSSYVDGYYTINRPLFRFLRIVEKGVIKREAYEYCKRNGVELDTGYWHISSTYEQIKSDILNFVFRTIIIIPWKIRVRIMETLRLIVISY